MFKKFLTLISFLFVPSIYAAEINSGDTSWILTSTALVLFKIGRASCRERV